MSCFDCFLVILVLGGLIGGLILAHPYPGNEAFYLPPRTEANRVILEGRYVGAIALIIVTPFWFVINIVQYNVSKSVRKIVDIWIFIIINILGIVAIISATTSAGTSAITFTCGGMSSGLLVA